MPAITLPDGSQKNFDQPVTVMQVAEDIGPGLAKVGAVENYGWFTDASKLVMTVLMLIGRLEVFAIVALFAPQFWRDD